MTLVRHFATQKAQRAFYQTLIAQIGVCSSLKTYHPEHFEAFKDLFSRHPDESKTANLQDIAIQKNPKYASLECIVLKPSGSESISYTKCITGKQETAEAKLKTAMRVAIEPQILAYRQTHVVDKCEFCNATTQLQIDHVKPFAELYSEFIRDKQPPKEFTKDAGHTSVFLSKDISFEAEWSAYHAANAELRVLCQGCNVGRNGGVNRVVHLG